MSEKSNSDSGCFGCIGCLGLIFILCILIYGGIEINHKKYEIGFFPPRINLVKKGE